MTVRQLRSALLIGLLAISAACAPKEPAGHSHSYQISAKAVCLYPHNSWLPPFYTQYDGPAPAADYGCADQHGSFQCQLDAAGQCHLSVQGQAKEEVFNCYAETGEVHCYGGGQRQHEYLVCHQADAGAPLTCAKGDQRYASAQPAPTPPWFDYGDLAATIRHFTQQSIDNAGLGDRIQIAAVSAPLGQAASIALTGPDQQLLERFASMHQRFLDDSHAAQGLAGAKACQDAPGCWEPYIGNSPWAFYLPLGLPMLGQKIVNYLNYPPYDALTSGDYLDNFTMARWNRVLASTGIERPQLYDTIVDARPIAAPGSGQSAYMPDIATYFNNSSDDNSSDNSGQGAGDQAVAGSQPVGGDYDIPMINLLADPAGQAPGHTLPVLVLGSDARRAWAQVTGQPVQKTLPYVGSVQLPGADKTTAWVASNHPDVTTYQCCPGDPSPSCSSGGYPSFSLVQDEQIDLVAICIAKTLSDAPGLAPEAAQQACERDWVSAPSAEHQQTLCVNAKLDYNFTASGQCASQAQAEAFCAHYHNQACPQGVYTCEF